MASREELEKAARAGDAESQYRLAREIELAGGPAAPGERWSDWCLRAAEQGHVGAMFALGTSLLDGDGVDPNVEEGVRWLERASEAGDEHAPYSLALLHLFGDRVPEDAERGRALARTAAERGHPRAQLLVATDLLDDGSAEALAEAKRWLGRATEAPPEDEAHKGVLVDALERLANALESSGRDAGEVKTWLERTGEARAELNGDAAAFARPVLEASAERFVREAVSTETVYFLEDAEGMRATGQSHDGEHDLMLVFSDQASARAVLAAVGEPLAGYQVEEESIFELLGATLPELHEEGLRVVPNCVADLAGVELEPRLLWDRLMAELSPAQRERYRELAESAAGDD